VTAASAPLAGGCLCGAIRYRCELPYRYAVHCHCGMCRKASGAAFMTWVCLSREDFAFTKGKPKVRQSSDEVNRGFCAQCGAQIYMDYRDSPTIDVSIGTLDHPETITVLDNIWVSSRLPLIKGFDRDLPQYDEFAKR
jgi:hypothetical protein